MSVQNCAVLCVGLAAKQVAKDFDQFYELYGDDVLNVIPTYYDASFNYSLIGIVIHEVEEGSTTINTITAQQRIYKAMGDFRKITGLAPELLLSTKGY